jgi:hypothetical protein
MSRQNNKSGKNTSVPRERKRLIYAQEGVQGATS